MNLTCLKNTAPASLDPTELLELNCALDCICRCLLRSIPRFGLFLIVFISSDYLCCLDSFAAVFISSDCLESIAFVAVSDRSLIAFPCCFDCSAVSITPVTVSTALLSIALVADSTAIVSIPFNRFVRSCRLYFLRSRFRLTGAISRLPCRRLYLFRLLPRFSRLSLFPSTAFSITFLYSLDLLYRLDSLIASLL